MTAPRIFDGEALRRARGRALARAGDKPDFLLARVAEDFCDRLAVIKRGFSDVLELGTHHGLLGQVLKRERGLARLTTADDAAAARPGVLVDFERLPFKPDSFDLAVSAFVLQSINDLPGTLAQLRACLKPDGLLLAAVAGGRTLEELRAALLQAETEIAGGASPRVHPMIDVRDFGSLLQRAGFALPVVDSDVVTVTYADPLALLHELRTMGATNVLYERRRALLRRDVLGRAIEIYRERFSMPDGRVRATFEILTATAWTPHESQQKPLKPGSAKARLADALGVAEKKP